MRDDKILKIHVEDLGLDQASKITDKMKTQLLKSLRDSKENALADYLQKLSPTELQDLIVNTIYG